MRELKFRAWLRGADVMYRHEDLSAYTFLLFTEKSNFEIMQYTGLKDKNGKEIYEGDIVEMGEMGRVWWRRGTVEMRQGCWCGRINHWQTPILSKTVNEVIGNIKENEELLNE